tara:strand:- start:706 stop:957 length:252 start_codon:yes stop_codon:yes gene_type:complete
MSLLKVTDTKAIENVNGENYHHGAMFVNSNSITNTVTLNTSENGLMIGPVSVHTLTVNGNLKVIDSLTVSTGNLTITGRLRII